MMDIVETRYVSFIHGLLFTPRAGSYVIESYDGPYYRLSTPDYEVDFCDVGVQSGLRSKPSVKLYTHGEDIVPRVTVPKSKLPKRILDVLSLIQEDSEARHADSEL